MPTSTIFITRAATPAGIKAARLLIESMRTFGGSMSDCPMRVFVPEGEAEDYRELASSQVEVIPLSVKEPLANYPFGGKVTACARAEELAATEVESLVWLDLECLVMQPPRLFELGSEYDAAFRPVHHRNVGIGAGEPLDAFWSGIYREIGVEDVAMTVESFIDRQRLRAYFNSHGFSIKPGPGLCRRWLEHFERLVTDEKYQQAACVDERHKIFLFQALLSALAASELGEGRIRMLPPSYNYPYNLQHRVPDTRRAAVLNELVTVTFEGQDIHPGAVRDIEVREPLRGWLESKVTPGGFKG